MGQGDPADLRADRNRWRHEYRIEKQKNALMRSDLRRLEAAADAVLAAWEKGALTDLMFEPIKQLREARRA